MKKAVWITILSCLILAAVLSFQPNVASAHEGYMTTYTHNIWQTELELMLMNDFTSPSEHKRKNDKQGDYLSHMVELEYAPTSQLAFEFMVEGFEDIESGFGKFTGFRYETRYRPFKDEIPLNPTLYAEYEDLDLETRYKMEVSGWIEPPYEEGGEEPDRERIMETRLILSQDFGPLNVAFNWINESDLSDFNSLVTAFGYSMGVLYRFQDNPAGDAKTEIANHAHHQMEEAKLLRPASLAFEIFGALGDSKSFGVQLSRQEHYFQPTMTFHVQDNSMLHVGFAIGLTKASDHIVRVNWGWMF